MRFSILGFNQERVCNLIAYVGGKEIKLDANDLLILNHIADFPNRSNIVKRIIDDNVYFWVSYDTILNELPILCIKKQALADRFKKYVALHLAKLELVNIDAKHQNSTFFCLTEVYESLLYEKKGYGSQLQEGMVVNYDTPYSSQLQDVYNNTNNNNITSYSKEEDTNVSPKKNLNYQEIVDCWNEANGKKLGKVTKLTDRRKKAIKHIIDEHDLTQEQLTNILKTIPYADSWLYNPTKEHKGWKPDFDWWMGNTSGWFTKLTEGKLHTENPQAFNMIIGHKEVSYIPQGRNIWYNEETKSYWSNDNFYYGKIFDGYDDNSRPDGAEITLSNARGTIVWNANDKEWIKK